MALATVAAFVFTPSTQTFVDGMRSREVWAGLHQRLLPKDRWFGVVNVRGRMTMHETPEVGADGGAATPATGEAAAEQGAELSTGSIAPATKPAQ